MNYIKETYDLPFLKKGTEINFQGELGKVIGAVNGKLKVKFESGEKAVLHPTWNIIYLENNEVLRDFSE